MHRKRFGEGAVNRWLLRETFFANGKGGSELKAKYFVALAAFLCVPVAGAQGVNVQAVKAIEEATRLMNTCAAIAARISSIPVPPGQKQAADRDHLIELRAAVGDKSGGAENSALAREARRKAREDYEKSLTPEQRAFMTNVREGRRALRDCGREYEKIRVSSLTAVKGAAESLASKKAPTEDDKKLGAVLKAYLEAQEKLSRDITSLSKNIEVQRYTVRVVSRYFLGTEDDNGRPVVPAGQPNPKK